MSRSIRLPRFHPLTTRLIALALVGLPLAFAGGRAAPNPDPARFEEAISRFEAWDRQNSFADNAVLFVGSSSIRGWATREYFPTMRVINRGFGGSHISDVNHFAARVVFPYKPRVIAFYAGDNDIADGKSPEQVRDDYQAFVKLVRAKLPATRVIFIAIKPSLSRWEQWGRMHEANALIRELTRHDDRLLYADIAPPMLGDDGKPRKELFVKDGLHLNSTGYKLWTGVLTPIIESALRDK